jgi:hypothetical protein
VPRGAQLRPLHRLKQRQPCVIEKGASGRGERDAARAALQQWNADDLKIAKLPAQGWLRGMERPLGGIGRRRIADDPTAVSLDEK